MKTITCLLLSPLALFGTTISTDYTAERSLRVERVMTVSSEVVDMVMVVDGEEREGGFGGGGANERELTITTIDKVLAHDEGAPTKVQRTLETISLEGSMTFRDEPQDFERSSESEGLVLILSLAENGDLEVEVKDGDEPEGVDFASLLMTQEIDALLSGEELDEGDSWDLDAEALVAGLGLGLEGALFGRAERTEERGERGERGGGGRRGGGGGRSGFNGAAMSNLDWEGEATWTDKTEDVDGVECIVISLEIEAEGTLPEREFGGRGGRGGGGGLWSPLGINSISALETSVELELEGQLLWSIKEQRAVSLSLSGDFVQDMERNMSRGDREMSMSSTTEGEIEIEVTISAD